jgi:uncharacterized glyoxalase superfamily protein PhnB
VQTRSGQETTAMTARISSVFLYVSDVVRSLDFYHEVVGAEITQVHCEYEGGPITLAILRLGNFTIMLHPQEPTPEPEADEYRETPKSGVGIHLQIQVDDVDKFYQHCIDEGALLSVSGEPIDQDWGWREFALKDPDGFVWSIYQDKSGGKWS